MSKWFILKNNSTSGPFSADEVQVLLSKGLLNEEQLIWSRLSKKWLSIESWKLHHHSQKTAQRSSAQQSPTWYFAQKGLSHGPFSKSKLVEELTHVKNLKEVLLWTQGMKSWSSLYEFHDLLNEVGVNARQHPRANIEGTFKYHISGQAFESPLASISQGGFGAINFGDFTTGQVVFGELLSQSFDNPIRFSAKVLYTYNTGFVGFKFENINQNDQNQVKNYIDKTLKLNPMAIAS